MISADWVAAGCAVIALGGGGVGSYLWLVDRRQEKAMEALEKRQDKVDDAKIIDDRNAELDRRALEKRIGDLERLAVTRTEHAEFRAEMLMTVDKVGERIGRSIEKFSAEIKEDMKVVHKRVTDIEARA